ncbi:MAG: 30S ribosomal protein S17 [Candidatus Vogelbacteria bacterium]|nr:30S ribosomal protein S17 [Candidatus Vogelbacteria bacterium]
MEQTTKQNNGKVLTGIVVSDKMDKTVVVSVKSYVKLPKYGKYVQREKRFKAHDPENRCKAGDQVSIRETRPISKDKHFEVVSNKQ